MMIADVAWVGAQRGVVQVPVAEELSAYTPSDIKWLMELRSRLQAQGDAFLLAAAAQSVLDGTPQVDHLTEEELLATVIIVMNTWGEAVRAAKTFRPSGDAAVLSATISRWMCTVPTWMAFLGLRNAGGGKEGKGLTGIGWLSDRGASWMPIFHAIRAELTARGE